MLYNNAEEAIVNQVTERTPYLANNPYASQLSDSEPFDFASPSRRVALASHL